MENFIYVLIVISILLFCYWAVKGFIKCKRYVELEKETEELEINIEEVPYATLSGWIMDELNKVPEVGDTFENSGYRFTVETVDGMRVDTALVEKLEPLSEAEEE